MTAPSAQPADAVKHPRYPCTTTDNDPRPALATEAVLDGDGPAKLPPPDPRKRHKSQKIIAVVRAALTLAGPRSSVHLL